MSHRTGSLKGNGSKGHGTDTIGAVHRPTPPPHNSDGDISFSVVNLSTPTPEAENANSHAAAAAATAATVGHGLPVFANEEELQSVEPPPRRRSQRVRFAINTDEDATPPHEGNTHDHNAGAAVPYGTGNTPDVSGNVLFNTGDDIFDFPMVDSITIDAENETFEPYSVITKTDGVHISLLTQLLALLERTYEQYRRQAISLAAEIITPLLFVALIIILNVAFGMETIKETNYASRKLFSYHLNSLDYQTYLCYNDTTKPINGLKSCSGLFVQPVCDGDESGIPVHGLCYPSYYRSINLVLTQYVTSMLGHFIAIPTLDSIIVHQWIAKKAGLAADSRTRTSLAALSNVGLGVSATTRYDSISYSGKLYFAPAANVPEALLNYIRSQSEMFDYVYGGTFETVAEALKTIKSSTATQQSLDSIWGLIIINDITDSFDVQIRLQPSALPTLLPTVSVKYRNGFNPDGTDMYLASGFVSLQKVLYDYFYSTKERNGDLPNVKSGTLSKYGAENLYTLAASFPALKSKNPYLLNFASSLVAFIMVLSFLFPFSQMTKRLVLEKELRIRESMFIMGLKRHAFWLNFFLVSFLEYVLICLLLTILLCAVVATRSCPFTIFLILLLYSLTLIPLSGLLSTFFSKARMAALMSPLIYFILSMLIFAMGSAVRGAIIGLSVLSSTGLAILMTNVFEAEAGSGFHTDDFYSPLFNAKPYIIMVMLACDVVLYMLLMLYFDLVLPQESGTHKHPLFFVKEPYSHWKQKRRAAASTQKKKQSAVNNSSTQSNVPVPEHSSDGPQVSNEDSELPFKASNMHGQSGASPSLGDPPNCPFDASVSRDPLTGAKKAVGVRIESLSKYFVRNGEKFAAVKDLSWNMYRGEISVLLGPNGAGKSTTINMITGMLPTDKGDCFIEGHSVTKETSQARHEIGYCPQHNILWPDLTCREHLEFYGKIKGLRGADLENAVVDILRAVDLEEKIDTIPTFLSGGQKRKLSVAIAFVGRNRVVLLDEPTAGMDPAARRHTWSLLRVMAEHHTIILTTHYMDEADLLGSNVAIVNGGSLQCSGTTQFLRSYVGVGYTVHFDLSPIVTVSDEERQRKVKAVWALLDEVVMRHLTGATLVLQTDAEVEYEMHQQAEARIPEFLKELESRGNRQLGVRGYSLKAPTLEDVFMRVVECQIPTRASQPQAPISNTMHSFHGRPLSFLARKLSNIRTGGEAADVGGAANNGSSQLVSHSLTFPPLQRRMSRASRCFFNDETKLNYAVDSETSEDSDNNNPLGSIISLSNFVKSPNNLSGYSVCRAASGSYDNACNNTTNNNKNVSSTAMDGGGESREPCAQSLLSGETPKTAKAGAAGAHSTLKNDGGASTIPAEENAVHNEAFLYKHVTDRHLDQVWASRSISRHSQLWALQLRGMMYKRFFCAIRDRRLLFFQIICPVLCILLAMLLQLVKNKNSGTVYFSPAAFMQRTSMPVSSCTNYYGPLASISNMLSSVNDVEVTDPNFISGEDLSYALLDTWHAHKNGRYIALQCGDPDLQTFLSATYSESLGSRSTFTILYNTSSHNSLPIALHTAYAMAYYAGLGNASPTFKMSVTSLPESKQSSTTRNAIAGILIGVIVLIPFTFLPANPVAWVVKEYETRARHLQTVSGLRYLIYWAGNFLFDFTSYLVTIALVIIIFVIFQRSEYIGYTSIGPTIVGFVLYGICYCWMAYMVSFMFSEHTTAQIAVLGFSFLSGFLCVMLVFVLSLMNKTLAASDTLRCIFRLLPPFAIGEVILNLALFEQKEMSDTTLNEWSMSITLWPFIYMIIETPIFAAVTLLWDHPNRCAVLERLRTSLRSCCGGHSHKKTEEVMHVQKDLTSCDTKGQAGGACAVPSANQLRAHVLQAYNSKPGNPSSEFGHSTFTSSTNINMPLTTTSSNVEPISEERAGSSISRLHPRASSSEYSGRDGENRQGNSFVALAPVPTASGSRMARTATASAAPMQSFLRQRSMSASAMTHMSSSMPLSLEFLYSPPQWFASDGACLQEEDGDVKEERNAVYSEERSYQEKMHDTKHGSTPTRTLTNPNRSKDHGGAVVQQTADNLHPSTDSTSQQMNADAIRVVDLRKVYDTPHKVAVSNLTFSVMHGEVFGFLGTNGAGKSSAISILTQEQPPTSGRAYVCGHDVMRDSFVAASCLGYCPQFDACLDLLTVEEHLRLYSLVRGVPTDRVESLVTSLLTICNLTEYRSVLSIDLSGGNRRKLSVAIALIGAPKVICLDEPTAGLDPLARRLMWRALDRVSRKCSVVLTTHHLEEVEALADCVGIMVDGSLRCFGDLPHLKHKYARSAYELTLCVSATARKRAVERREKAGQQSTETATASSRRCSGSAALPNSAGGSNGTANTSFLRNRHGSFAYAGTDRIDTTDDIFQFMLRHFPSALLVDAFNNERFVYTLPATRDVVDAMQRLQSQQQRRGSISFCNKSGTFGFASSVHSSLHNPIVRLSDVFEKLRSAQDVLGITEYSVSQVSLEQVFLRVCGTTEEARKAHWASFSMGANESTSFYHAGPSSSSLSRHHTRRQQQRNPHNSSASLNNGCHAPAAADAPTPYRRCHSAYAMGGVHTRVTFSEYRRQRAVMRLRTEAEMPNSTPSEVQHFTEPDHEGLP
ncbi:ABC1 transporter-like protein [Leptomonas seymouri]|uniref:ABC1 transporter-like protein n=1 Tax=Leptomonas seymouri TaxID=5684 RepID=A0A0N0P6B9_LEPSE|nr:ABC1 transporter-like protein [Leptomonas seymouri]|eukprot:KPI87456.1 ABC1 transporter-like protein [Leptomonas seymouri]